MPRYKVIIEYDGTPYAGWQVQAETPTVQGEIEAAIAAFCGHAVRVQCAGRTDAGVHATHQVINVDLEKDFRPDQVRDATNAHLKRKGAMVAVVAANKVDGSFNARISARKRHYLYRILNRRPRPALDANRVWHVPWQLDAGIMHQAAQLCLGEHDFSTFRASECQAKSPVKTLDKLNVERVGEEIRVWASARSFLHHQVRSMVGTLAQAGAGRWSVADVKAALDAKDRTRCGPMAPPTGLYLIGVDYEE